MEAHVGCSPGYDMMDNLPFGDGLLPLQVARGQRVARLAPNCPTPPASAADIIRNALLQPIGGPRLADLARGKRTAAILIPGQDRIAATEIYVPLILEQLHAAGIADENIAVTVATGTHAKHTPADIRRLLGDEAADRVRAEQHNCRPGPHLAELGVTSFGTPVELNRAVVEADVKILTGRIIPHYFAGFGGGRKAILPGVASVRTILHNHALTLAPGRGIHPAIRACSLQGNPVHLDMVEAARLVAPTFILNTLLDTEHRMVSAVAGDLEAAHQAGCALAREWFCPTLPAPVDAVIASPGGWPYDCDFVQALKTLFDVQDIVRPGGAILWIASCRQGIKEGFLKLAALGDDDELETAVRAHYTLAGHNSIMLRALRHRARIALYSDLADTDVRLLGLEPVHSLNEGVEWLQQLLPPDFRYAVVPFANVTHAGINTHPNG